MGAADSLASLRGRIGGLALAAQRDPREYTAAARAAFLVRFEEMVDPDGLLSPAERQRRAEAAKKEHFARLALKSAKTRASKKKSPIRSNGSGDGTTPQGADPYGETQRT